MDLILSRIRTGGPAAMHSQAPLCALAIITKPLIIVEAKVAGVIHLPSMNWRPRANRLLHFSDGADQHMVFEGSRNRIRFSPADLQASLNS